MEWLALSVDFSFLKTILTTYCRCIFLANIETVFVYEREAVRVWILTESNDGARFAAEREMARTPGLRITLPNPADELLIKKALTK